MRLLVVTNCQAQVALEVVWQQEQASGRAPGGRRRGSDGLMSIGAWTSGDMGLGGQPSSLLFPHSRDSCAQPHVPSHTHTHTPTHGPDTPLGSPWGRMFRGQLASVRSARCWVPRTASHSPSSFGPSALGPICSCPFGSISSLCRPSLSFSFLYIILRALKWMQECSLTFPFCPGHFHFTGPYYPLSVPSSNSQNSERGICKCPGWEGRGLECNQGNAGEGCMYTDSQKEYFAPYIILSLYLYTFTCSKIHAHTYTC